MGLENYTADFIVIPFHEFITTDDINKSKRQVEHDLNFIFT